MPHANVVLIPTIDEYHSAGIAHRLWYNEYDFRSFKTSTAKEVQSFVKDKPKISNKEALKLYCQQLGEEEGKEEQRPIEVVASVTESVSPVSTATIAVEEVPVATVATPLVTVSEEEDAKNSDSNNKDEKDGQEETLENILMILAKELGCEEAAVAGNSDVNMSVHIITYYERFRSDSLTLPNSNNSRKMHNNSNNNNNNNNLIASGPALDAPPQQQQQQAAAAAFVPSSLPQQQQGEEGWTVFNLLPEMNRSSETLAILAQLIALVSLTVVIPSE